MVITQVKIPQEKGDGRCLSLCYCYFFPIFSSESRPKCSCSRRSWACINAFVFWFPGRISARFTLSDEGTHICSCSWKTLLYLQEACLGSLICVCQGCSYRKKGPSGEIEDFNVEKDSLGGLSIIFHSEIITGGLDPRGLRSLGSGHLQSQQEVK